ncbi:MAG: nickel-dependent hydrogenase large subunit [Rhodospirillaceae bacterium]
MNQPPVLQSLLRNTETPVPMRRGSHIVLTLFLSGNRISTVDIGSSRTVTAGRILTKKNVNESLGKMSSVVTDHLTAHTVAGVRAVEAAMGVRVARSVNLARDVLLMRDMLEDHILRMVLDWPVLGAEPADPGAARGVKGILGELPAMLFPDGDGLSVGGGTVGTSLTSAMVDRLHDIRSHLTRTVMGREAPPPWRRTHAKASSNAEAGSTDHPSAGAMIEPPLAADDPEAAMLDWCDQGDTSTSRLFARLMSKGMAAMGASTNELMPDLAEYQMEMLLSQDQQGRFRQHPHWKGRVFETGALARMASHPAIQALRKRYRSGLLSRFAAHLVEAFHLIDQMEITVEKLVDTPLIAPSVVSPGPQRPSTGLGNAECVGGRIYHWARLTGDQVVDYRILPPTAWNFHPEGPLVTGMTNVRVPDEDHAMAFCRFMVSALDPSVAWEARMSAS